MAISLPVPRITKEQLHKFLTDPEVVTLEILFVFLTICNVFVLYRILLDVCPFPVVVTWFQIVTGLVLAVVLGETSQEFPKCALFPPFSVDMKLYEGLAMSTFTYLGMITMANVLLRATPNIAVFPVIVSLAVTMHHLSRFCGCGQIYMPIRWISLAIMFAGFFIAIFDKKAMGFAVFPLAVLYAVFSAVYRAWCLEKAMHVVEGQGTKLHNQQVMMGLICLPVVALLFGEWRVFQWMPSDLSSLFTWQAWGCLISAGIIPFIKNIVANRLTRRTGRAPWRVLEAFSMLIVFIVGAAAFNSITAIGTIAFIMVLCGRVLGMLDVLSQDPNDRRRAIRQEPKHASEPQSLDDSAVGNYDPTGVADSFDRPDKYSAKDSSVDNVEQQQELEMRNEVQMQTTMNHSATKPLLFMEPIQEEMSAVDHA